MTREQEQRLHRLLSRQGPDESPPSVVSRLRVFRSVLLHEQAQYEELYTRGGGHVKDAFLAAKIAGYIRALDKLIPEILE